MQSNPGFRLLEPSQVHTREVGSSDSATSESGSKLVGSGGWEPWWRNHPFFPNKNPAVLRPSCFFWPDCEWRNNCLGVLLQTWENFPAVWRCKLLSWWLWQNVQSLDTLHQGFFGFETFGLLVACPGSIGFTPNNFWNTGFLTHWAHLLYLLLVSSWLTGTWWKVKDMSFKAPVFAFHLW